MSTQHQSYPYRLANRVHADISKCIYRIEQELDKHLDKLDSLRNQTEQQEAKVMALIHKQRLLKEKLAEQN